MTLNTSVVLSPPGAAIDAAHAGPKW